MARETVSAYAGWLRDSLESELRGIAEQIAGYGGETNPYPDQHRATVRTLNSDLNTYRDERLR